MPAPLISLFANVFGMVTISEPFMYLDPAFGFATWNYEKEFPRMIIIPDNFDWNSQYTGPEFPEDYQMVNIMGTLTQDQDIIAFKIWVDDTFDEVLKNGPDES